MKLIYKIHDFVHMPSFLDSTEKAVLKVERPLLMVLHGRNCDLSEEASHPRCERDASSLLWRKEIFVELPDHCDWGSIE